MAVWRNPDHERTNQNARIYLKTTLPYNNAVYFYELCRILTSP